MKRTGITTIVTTVLAAITVTMATALTGCNTRTTYSEFRSPELKGWHKDSTFVYDIHIADTLALYDIILSVRHRADYPYQNIWLFVDNALTGTRDTLEYYLADQRGRWLGNRFGDRKEMPCLLAQGVRFPRSGNYRFAVTQGMREEYLRGITEIGLIVEKQ